MSADTDQFYARLPVNRSLISEVLLKDKLFYPVPADWYVIITDIKNSTVAVLNGLHENVNLIAAGSIVSVLNIAFKAKIAVPFFFGGDGATFIVPPSLIDKVMSALVLYQERTLANVNLRLRIGTVPVHQIYERGHQLSICKFSFSEIFPIPIVLGTGLNFAEQLIKGDDYLLADHPLLHEELDLNGMQCRWDRIAPPENREEVVTLLVVALDATHQNRIFSQVMQHIDEIYGTPQNRQPISVAQLRLKTNFYRLGKEIQVRFGKARWFKLLQLWLLNTYGSIYFLTQEGKHYLNRLVEMSDTLVIDGKINTVITGIKKQRLDLQAALDKLETAGIILYGLHVSNSSIMSCYVRDQQEGHIHFVDGAEGGYTQASVVLKSKLRKLQ
jgi:hypothetical protein